MMTPNSGVLGAVVGSWLVRVWRSDPGLRWRAAILLGLASGTFSTLISQLTAARIGRDAVVDWMVVANIPLRDAALRIVPDWTSIAAGILFHQSADFSWALFFFGVMGRLTGRLHPGALALIAIPWALFTSAMEWLFLVPVFPFVQPIFPLEQPYWIGFLVHFSSASIYPIFPWLRNWLAGALSPHRRFAAVHGALAASGLIFMGALAFFGSHDHELPWIGRDETADQSYIRRMAAHHAQGILVARIAVDQAVNPHLRALARLIAAEQIGENKIFEQWSRSWFLIPPQICSPEEQASMPGMLTAAQIDELSRTDGPAFDALFVRLMSFHHAGAVQMADEEFKSDGDIRLRIMAEAIRHAQQGEIELMHGAHGFAATRPAIVDMFVARYNPEEFKK
jgi:uncharacterized protein (DUF305 family)